MEFTPLEIIEKLIGEIRPAGRSEIDQERYLNLIDTEDLIFSLLQKMQQVAECKDSFEGSVSRAGKRADVFLRMIKEEML